MEALIRSARLAPARTRLGAARADGAPAPAHDVARVGNDPAPSTPVDLDALHARIEQALREQLAAQARDLFEAERQRGHAEGLAAGQAAAEAQATQRQAEALGEWRARAEAALAVLEQAHGAALSRWETSVGEVAFACVCRLVGRQAMSPDFVRGLVEQTVAGLRAEGRWRARVHPRDLDTLQRVLEDRAPAGAPLRLQALSLEVVADESLALGGCVIETAAGQYDGALEVQLRRLHELLCAPPAADPSDAPCRS